MITHTLPLMMEVTIMAIAFSRSLLKASRGHSQNLIADDILEQPPKEPSSYSATPKKEVPKSISITQMMNLGKVLSRDLTIIEVFKCLFHLWFLCYSSCQHTGNKRYVALGWDKWICCSEYDGECWLPYALDDEENTEEVLVKFLHPAGLTASFSYRGEDDTLLLPRTYIL